MNILEDDKKFIMKYIPDAENVLKSTNIREVLEAISDWIDDNGFEAPDYYDYNELGREAQKVYDRIYLNN